MMIEDEEDCRDVGDSRAAILDQAALQQRAYRPGHVGRERLPVRLEADSTAPSTSVMSSPSKARRPVNIS